MKFSIHKHFRQGDKGNISENEVGQTSGDKSEDVGFFVQFHPGVKTQRRSHLLGSLLDGDYLRGALLKSEAREATGRRADVEDDLATEINAQRLRSSGDFLVTASRGRGFLSSNSLPTTLKWCLRVSLPVRQRRGRL